MRPAAPPDSPDYQKILERNDAVRYNAEPMRDFPVYLWLGLVLLIGLGLFMLGARNLRCAIASRHWPTASATVVESSTSIDVTPPSRSMRRSRNSVSSIMYTANIRFQYEVNGRAYRTDQIWFGQTAGSDDSSEAELRRFRDPLGKQEGNGLLRSRRSRDCRRASRVSGGRALATGRRLGLSRSRTDGVCDVQVGVHGLGQSSYLF